MVIALLRRCGDSPEDLSVCIIFKYQNACEVSVWRDLPGHILIFIIFKYQDGYEVSLFSLFPESHLLSVACHIGDLNFKNTMRYLYVMIRFKKAHLTSISLHCITPACVQSLGWLHKAPSLDYRTTMMTKVVAPNSPHRFQSVRLLSNFPVC